MTYCIDSSDIEAAYERIKGMVNRTPVLTSRILDDMSGRTGVFFKTEAYQKTGSFKFRGATNAVMSLPEAVAAAGVCTHSSGNHAQALAFAAKAAGIPANIVMPTTAPLPKQNAVRGYGANVVMCSPAAREPTCSKVASDTGGTIVHPSEDPRVIAGQGTVSLEWLQQMQDEYGGKDLNIVIIPVGGGGLAGGNAVMLRAALGKNVVIVLAEPAAADDAARSFASKEHCGHVGNIPPTTVADGLKTTLGPNTWPLVRDLVDDVMTVDDRTILECTHLIWTRMKVMIEPSAGVGVGVLLSDQFRDKYPASKYPNVGVVLCGGNVDVLQTAQLMQEHGIS